MYNPQTTVTWQSSSQGSTIEKTGVIICFLPPHTVPIEQELWLGDLKPSELKFNPSELSKNQRYIVKVSLSLKRAGTKDVYYAPRASLLNPVDN